MREVEVSVVNGRRIPSTGSFVLRRIFALGLRFEGAMGRKSQQRDAVAFHEGWCGDNADCAGSRFKDILDTLLRPVQIALDLLGGLHAVGEVGAGAFKTPLRKGLQLEQLAVFGVECPGAICVESVPPCRLDLAPQRRRGEENLRLRLRGQTPVQGEGIESAVQAVAEHLDEIDAVPVAGGRGGLVLAARAAAVAA